MGSIRMAPYILARLAGLPGALLQGLGHPALAAAWQRLAELDLELAQVGAPLCDALHPVVARCGDADPAGRTRIINLRRAIHNGRNPGLLEEIWPLLTPAEAELLHGWLRSFQERTGLWRTLPTLWAAAVDQSRGALQSWSGDPGFQAGLVLASESIWQKLQEYRATPLGAQPARLRKMEPALAMYLTRASAKTSPFSTFALLGYGAPVAESEPISWAGAAEAVGAPVAARGAERPATAQLPTYGLAALNQALLNRLATNAARHPALRRSALLRRGALVRIETDRIVAYGRLDQAGNSRVAYTGERMIALPRNPAVEAVLAQVSGSTLRWRSICQQLGGAATWEPILAFMIEHHLLEATWAIDESAPDFPGAFADRLSRIRSETARTLRRHLLALSGLTQRLPLAPAAERPDLLRAMVAALQGAFAAIGEELGELAGAPVFEEVAIGGAKLAVGAPFWAEALDSLARLQALLPLFAQRRVRQQALHAAFIERYGPGGRCTDLPTFLLELPETLPATPDPVITDLRARFIAEIQKAAARDGSLDLAALEAIAAAIPAVLKREPVGFGYFVQPLPTTKRLMLTEILPGFGRAPARFLHLLDPEGAALRPAISRHLAAALPLGSSFLDVPGTFGFNASRRPPLVQRELRYPGAEATGSAQVIDLESLHLIEADGALQLVDARSGERLHPLDLHALTPVLGPTLWGKLMELQVSTAVTLPLQEALYAAPSAQIQHLPQIRLGQLVLSRRTWLVPTKELPHRPKGAPDWEWATVVDGWRRAHGLPERVYIRATLDPAGRFFQGIMSDRPVRDQQRKPQYIDFSSPVLLRVFERHLEEVEESLVIEECLPDRADWLPGPDGAPRLMEWYLELDGVERGGDQLVADDPYQLLGREPLPAAAGGSAPRR